MNVNSLKQKTMHADMDESPTRCLLACYCSTRVANLYAAVKSLAEL